MAYYGNDNDNFQNNNDNLNYALSEYSYDQKIAMLKLEIAKTNDHETRRRLEVLLNETIAEHDKKNKVYLIGFIIFFVLIGGFSVWLFLFYFPNKDTSAPYNQNATPIVSTSQSSESDTQVSVSETYQSNYDQSQEVENGLQNATPSQHTLAEQTRTVLENNQGFDRQVLNSISDDEIVALTAGYVTNSQLAQTADNLLAKYPNLKIEEKGITKDQFRRWVAQVWDRKHPTSEETGLLNNPKPTLTLSTDSEGYATASIALVQSDTVDFYRINSNNELEESAHFAGEHVSPLDDHWVLVESQLPEDLKN